MENQGAADPKMLTERRRMGCHLFADGSLDGHGVDGIAMISSPLHPSSPPSSPSCIHHRVSKMDTLAGLAIKYGVEVIIVLLHCYLC